MLGGTVGVRAFSAGLAAVAILLAGPTPASAQRPASVTKGKAVDISPIVDKLVIAHDGRGHYIAFGRGLPRELFYGDGKTFYRQYTMGGSLDSSSNRTGTSFWAPTAKGNGVVELRANQLFVSCRSQKSELKLLSAAETAAMLKKAKFRVEKWQRQPHALARDRIGRYYFVDRASDAAGGKDYRLFVGRQGAMKMMKLRDIVSDSEGEVFLTPRGEFRLVLDKGEASWVRGKRKPIPLTVVPPRRNQPQGCF